MLMLEGYRFGGVEKISKSTFSNEETHMDLFLLAADRSSFEDYDVDPAGHLWSGSKRPIEGAWRTHEAAK